MTRAMLCTCVNGSHAAKCQMRNLWEKNKFMKIRKNGEKRHVTRSESGEEASLLTNSVNDNQKERKRSERRK